MKYLNNIKELIEKDIVLKKKHRLIENNSTLSAYFEIGRLINEAGGDSEVNVNPVHIGARMKQESHGQMEKLSSTNRKCVLQYTSKELYCNTHRCNRVIEKSNNN